ncbi:MAG: hypothetical protein V3T72_04885 [Thermoanaerobaculia bacterium]
MNSQHDRRLMRLIHGELAADEARVLERQIAGDSRLAARYRSLAAVWNDLEVPATASAPVDFMAGVVAAARRQGSGLPGSGHPAGEISWSLAPVWARAGSMAALILGLVLGTSFGVDTGTGFSEPELTGDQEAYLLLAEPASLAESFWLTLEETEGRLDNGDDGGERVR